MQTFVPYGSDFIANARVLDRQRLGKQRVETWQILNALRGLSKGWTNHPATRMWRGYEGALAQYGAAMCREWIARGYHDTMLERFYPLLPTPFDPWPHWLGWEDVAISHRSNLIRKDPGFYGPLWPDVAPDLPYLWPVVA
jgi:hypothetical protein